MFRINVLRSFPRSVHTETLYIVGVRRTMLGVHFPSDEHGNSKTNIVATMRASHAARIRDALIQTRRPIQMDNGSDVISFGGGSLFKPYVIEEVAAADLEQLCLLRFFDILIVNNLVERGDVLEIECYKYITAEPPNRSILIKMLEDSLRG